MATVSNIASMTAGSTYFFISNAFINPDFVTSFYFKTIIPQTANFFNPSPQKQERGTLLFSDEGGGCYLSISRSYFRFAFLCVTDMDFSSSLIFSIPR